MPLPQHAQPPPLASICPTTPPWGVVMHVEARRVVGHVKGADGTGRDRMGLDGKGTKTAQYRAPGRPRSSRRHGSIANSIFYRLEASMSDSTIKHKNVRIPSHRASQKLSTARFDSKFNFLSFGSVDARFYENLRKSTTPELNIPNHPQATPTLNMPTLLNMPTHPPRICLNMPNHHPHHSSPQACSQGMFSALRRGGYPGHVKVG